MKIATCTVSLEGYEDPGWNNTRLAVLSDVFVASRALQVDLLCLPAGYLTVDSTLEIERISKTIREEAKKHRIAVAVGIDAKNLTHIVAFPISQYAGLQIRMYFISGNNVLHRAPINGIVLTLYVPKSEHCLF